jgi:hypothetical protein
MYDSLGTCTTGRRGADTEKEDVMAIESRTIVGSAAALAIVGIGLWASTTMLNPPVNNGTVEVQQINERSWAVEVKELGANEGVPVQTAAR